MDIEDKSLLPSFYKREELPLFGILSLSLDRQRGASLPAGRQGEIFRTICLFNYGLLSNYLMGLH